MFTSVSEIDRSKHMRGVVIRTDDPHLEGRIALHIPKLVTKFDHQNIRETTTTTKTNTSIISNKEFISAINTDVKHTNIIWCRPAHQNNYEIPYKGQVVYCYFEDGDPQKPYYLNDTPTLNGDAMPMAKLKATKHRYESKTKPLVRVFFEGQDSTIHYFDENEETKRYAITFKNNHSISINENSNENSIELITESGHRIVLDQKNKHVTVNTSKGHKMVMHDVSEDVLVQTIAGHKIHIQDKAKAIQLHTVSGHDIRMDDSSGNINLNAGTGGKVRIGNGTVSIM